MFAWPRINIFFLMDFCDATGPGHFRNPYTRTASDFSHAIIEYTYFEAKKTNIV